MDIEVLILAQLMKGPKHGYEIKKNIGFVMSNNKIINNNTLYPKLKLFEERGLVISKEEPQPRRPNRFVYSITAEGEQVFHERLNDFTEELIRDESEWTIRLAYYEVFEPEARRRLLSYREAYVNQKQDHIRKLSEVMGSGEDLVYSNELYVYMQMMLDREREVIQELYRQIEE